MMRNELKIIVVLLLILFLNSIDSSASTVAKGQVIYQVIDETNSPVVGAKFSGGGWIPDGSYSSEFSAITDSDGIAVINVRTAMDMGGKIIKDGFYRSSFYYMFADKGEEAILNGRWQPWGITKKVVLKRIRNPIPMYVKRVDAIVPVMGQAVGYDLEKGDWVGDHGNGIISDLVFTVAGNYVDNFNRDLQMTVMFSNSQDGIITQIVPVHNGSPTGSMLISAHEAPATGYEPKYTYTRKMREKLADCVNMDTRGGQLTYFRVRTEVDDKGNIVKAWYGKMLGDFHCHFDFDKKVRVSFTYYFNPTPNDQNVEFDLKKNLFLKTNTGYRKTSKLRGMTFKIQSP